MACLRYLDCNSKQGLSPVEHSASYFWVIMLTGFYWSLANGALWCCGLWAKSSVSLCEPKSYPGIPKCLVLKTHRHLSFYFYFAGKLCNFLRKKIKMPFFKVAGLPTLFWKQYETNPERSNKFALLWLPCHFLGTPVKWYLDLYRNTVNCLLIKTPHRLSMNVWALFKVLVLRQCRLLP